jgi:hypothetical protein
MYRKGMHSRVVTHAPLCRGSWRFCRHGSSCCCYRSLTNGCVICLGVRGLTLRGLDWWHQNCYLCVTQPCCRCGIINFIVLSDSRYGTLWDCGRSRSACRMCVLPIQLWLLKTEQLCDLMLPTAGAALPVAMVHEWR